MATRSPPRLTEDEIDELLYIARANETDDLEPYLNSLTQTHTSNNKAEILAAAVDSESGNTVLHFAGANGHVDLFRQFLTYFAPSPDTTPLPGISPSRTDAAALSTTFLNYANTSGNTPLHYAALNGQLEIVKLLIGAGADASILNKAGYDCVYEAERAGKEEVAEWLLREAVGLEKGIGVGDEGFTLRAGQVNGEGGQPGSTSEASTEEMEQEDQGVDSIVNGAEELDLDGKPTS